MRRTKKYKKFRNKKTKSYKQLLHSARKSLLAKAGMIADRSSPPMGIPVDFDYDRNSVLPPMGIPVGSDIGQTSNQVPQGAPVGLYPVLTPLRSTSNNSEYHDALDPSEYHVERITTGVDPSEAIDEYADYIYTEVMNAKTAKERADIVRMASNVHAFFSAKYEKLDKEFDLEFGGMFDFKKRELAKRNNRARYEMMGIAKAKVKRAANATKEIELWAKKNTAITAVANRSLNKGLTRATQKIMSAVR